ncbi:hypothetical protein IAU60_006126 [Kwoniella sp. DSM 27419]
MSSTTPRRPPPALASIVTSGLGATRLSGTSSIASGSSSSARSSWQLGTPRDSIGSDPSSPALRSISARFPPVQPHFDRRAKRHCRVFSDAEVAALASGAIQLDGGADAVEEDDCQREDYPQLRGKEIWWTSNGDRPHRKQDRSAPRLEASFAFEHIPHHSDDADGILNLQPVADDSPTLRPSPARHVHPSLPLDDSPTLPPSRPMSHMQDLDVPPLSLPSSSRRQDGHPHYLSEKARGKLPMQYGTARSGEDDLFGVGWTAGTGLDRSYPTMIENWNAKMTLKALNAASASATTFDPRHRPFTARRPPTIAPAPVLPGTKPVIPSRTSSRRTPKLPARGSSLASLSANANASALQSYPPTSFNRPIPARKLSHPPPSTLNSTRASSLKKKRLSPTPNLLHSISETPKDLDHPPQASWALRPPAANRLSRLHRSSSCPQLRTENSNMTLKFKLRRSNSQSAGGHPDVLSFPTPVRRDSDVGERDRSSRNSMSDIARSFIPRSTSTSTTSSIHAVPDSPNSRPSGGSDGSRSLSLRRSPKMDNLLGLRPRAGVRRPSLLGLPGSPNPITSRSVSDGAVNMDRASGAFALSLPMSRSATLTLPSRTTPSISLDLPRHSSHLPAVMNLHHDPDPDRDLICGVPLPPTFESHSLAMDVPDLATEFEEAEQDWQAVYEAESWTWPSPPFRIQTTQSTPGLSTSGTMDSLFTPLTPSESVDMDHGVDGEADGGCWLHGEAEWLERSGFGRGGSAARRKQGWRPLSAGAVSLRSLDIAL